jgi:hypothetical protein
MCNTNCLLPANAKYIHTYIWNLQVQLVDFNPWNGAQLWVPSPPRPQDDGFYQIKPYTQDSMALNGLGGYAYDGTVIGIYPDTPVSPNTLWATRNVY